MARDDETPQTGRPADEAEATRTPRGRGARRPKGLTRKAILERSYELYVAGRLAPGDERLAVVLDDLGYSSGAGYQIWVNQAAFRADLQVFVAQRLSATAVASVERNLAAMADAPTTAPLEQLLASCLERLVAELSEGETFYLLLRFFSMADDRPEEVTGALHAVIRQIEQQLEQHLVALLPSHGRRMRAGRGPGQLSGAVFALAQGLALRRRASGPDRADRGRDPLIGGARIVIDALVAEHTEPLPFVVPVSGPGHGPAGRRRSTGGALRAGVGDCRDALDHDRSRQPDGDHLAGHRSGHRR